MTDAEFLDEVKKRLAITGSFHDELLAGYIQDVKAYLTRAGVEVFTEACTGVIARGVSDIWNFGSGDGKFSAMFYDMASQLVLYKEGENA